MSKVIWLLLACLFAPNARAQLFKRAELSLVNAERMLLDTRQRYDSVLVQKGYHRSKDDSSTVRNGLKTYTYKNEKGYLIRLTAKADSLKTVCWDEPVSSIHLLFEEAKALGYIASVINPAILDNKHNMTILVFVPQVNRLQNTAAILLARKK